METLRSKSLIRRRRDAKEFIDQQTMASHVTPDTADWFPYSMLLVRGGKSQGVWGWFLRRPNTLDSGG